MVISVDMLSNRGLSLFESYFLSPFAVMVPALVVIIFNEPIEIINRRKGEEEENDDDAGAKEEHGDKREKSMKLFR